MAKLASKTYGNALFELALEEDKVDLFVEEVKTLKTAFEENEELIKLMEHPKIDKEEKKQVMKNILDGFVSGEVAGFVDIMIAKDRFREWRGIFDYFIDTVKEYRNIGTAYVTTAVELKDTQKERVEARLLETTKYEKMDVIYQVDASLIGGMVIRIRDRVVDSSVKTRLKELTKELNAVRIASNL